MESQENSRKKNFSISLIDILNNSIKNNKNEELQKYISKKISHINDSGRINYNFYVLQHPSENSTIDEKGNINIEFIPVNKELLVKENIHYGNIHQFGRYLAQTLNSIASSEYGFQSNMALHSDEGGRPFIVEIDFPVAYFLPEEMKVDVSPFGPFGMIEDIDNFLDFLLYANKPRKFEGNIVIYLNHGWFLDLILNAMNTEELKKLLPLLKDYIKINTLHIGETLKKDNLYKTDLIEKIEKEIGNHKTKEKNKFENYRKKILSDFLGFKAPMNKTHPATDEFLQKLALELIIALNELYFLKTTSLNNIMFRMKNVNAAIEEI
jgi:hypothetical protein